MKVSLVCRESTSLVIPYGHIVSGVHHQHVYMNTPVRADAEGMEATHGTG